LDVSREQMDLLRMGALTAIDGIWFMAAEGKLGFDTALELDMEVWKNYGTVMLKRVAKAMGVRLDPDEPPDLVALCRMMEVLCDIDGTRCLTEVIDEDNAVLTVERCAWWDNLTKAGRQDIIPCEDVDNNTFVWWLETADPSLEMEITHSLPRGDERCEWKIRRRR
jgi:Family of unknown function (DUF6125)